MFISSDVKLSDTESNSVLVLTSGQQLVISSDSGNIEYNVSLFTFLYCLYKG